MDFTLTKEQLDRVFPHHLILDKAFNVKSCCNKIYQLTGPIEGQTFNELFVIKEKIEGSPISNLSAKLIGRSFYLQLISHPETVFFGKLEYIGLEKEIIFYGDLENGSDKDKKTDTVCESIEKAPNQRSINQLIIDEKRYRDLYLYSPALIYTHSIEGKLLSCNPAAQRLLGYAEKDLIGLDITELLPAYDRKSFQTDYLDKVMSEGGSKGIFRIFPRNGKGVLYMYYQNYKVEELNSISYIIGFSQDITARIKMEKDLRFSMVASENLVKQKEFFLANMSHEIRTPINGILGLNNLLLKTELDEKQEHYVRLSSESINSLLILINDILDIEKIGFGKIGFESHPFNISHKVARTFQLFQHKAKESGLEIFLNDNINNKELTVIGDQYRFSQILSNLLSNAIKFTKAGSINVTVNMVHELEDQVKIAFSIKDTGIGLSEKSMMEIFKPFVQASVSTARNYGGTGLGLSICKKLIEMQGGHIKVYSKLGKGTEFVFTLTYKKDSKPAVIENEPAVIDYSRLKGKRVLIGEDVELNQFLIRNILESWGCEIDIVDNGIKIIDQLNAKTYDVILMDIQMPEMDGLTAAKHIRGMKDKAKAGIPIVAFTAGAMKGDIQKYKSVKMNDFILKPYSEKYLFDKMISVLNLTEPILNGENSIEKKQAASLSKEQLYDLSPIKDLSKNDDEVFSKILNILISMLSTENNNIKFFAKKRNWKAIAESVHKIKTSLTHINAHSLTRVIKRLEHYENYPDERLTLLTNELCDSLDNVLVFLKIDLVALMK